MTNCPTVIKVGGSLLSSRHGLARATTWMNNQRQHAPWVVVTGGGIWADRIRELDDAGSLSNTEAHGLALRSMSLTAWMFAQVVNCPHFTCWKELQAWQPPSAACCVFDAAEFCQRIKPGSVDPTLPVGWEVTSDSIAARVAVELNAEQLILLKSASPRARDIVGAANEGYVDPFFPRAADRLTRIRCVNLGGSGPMTECCLSTEPAASQAR